MRAGAKGEMLPAVRPLDVQAIRVGENLRISVGWTEAQKHSLAFADFSARYSDVVCSKLIDKRSRGLVTKCFLDRSHDETRVSLQSLQLIRVSK